MMLTMRAPAPNVHASKTSVSFFKSCTTRSGPQKETCRRNGRPPNDAGEAGPGPPYVPLSKLLVSPLITPIVVPYIIPYISPLRSLDYSSYACSKPGRRPSHHARDAPTFQRHANLPPACRAQCPSRHLHVPPPHCPLPQIIHLRSSSIQPS